MQTHNHAEITRSIHEDPSLSPHMGFILSMAARTAGKCRCGRLSCTACGFTKFYQRVRRIETNPNVKFGLLTGGRANPSML